MKNILFVCTGNTCRSPMAEAMFRKMLRHYNIKDIECSSAGLQVDAGESASKLAIEVMSEVGIDITAHRAKLITLLDIKNADMIYCMSPSQKAVILQLMPNFHDNIHVLSDNESPENVGVPDPFGFDIDVYRGARNSIEKALDREIKSNFIDKND